MVMVPRVLLVLSLVAVQHMIISHAEVAYANVGSGGGNAGDRDGQGSSGDSTVDGSTPFARRPAGAPLFTGSAGLSSGQSSNRRLGASFSGAPASSDPSPGQPGGFPGLFQNRFNQYPQAVTVNSYVTLTDVALQTAPVTLTQLVVHTTTHRVNQVVTTPVNDHVAISTSVVIRPAFVTVTETKSDFRMVTLTSLTYFTVTHTSHLIRHTTFTTTATEFVSVTSAIVRTVVSTQRDVVTDFHTVYNTVYVKGGYY